MTTQLPHDAFLLASDADSIFGRGVRLERIAESGSLHRVARGVYLESTVWAGMDAAERYRARVLAVARTHPSAVVSHQSAAALWGLPTLFQWPDEVHFIVDRASGGRSTPRARKHAIGIDSVDVAEVDGVLLTGLARTVIDVATSVDLRSAVAVADRVLACDRFGRFPPLATREQLRLALHRALPLRGSARADAVIEFATHLAGSPAESGSRVTIALAGFPSPVLQQEFVIEGAQYDVDFFWLELNGIGECDGKGKYFPRSGADLQTARQIFWAEKQREDRLRTRVDRFTRWDFAVGMSQQLLTRRLLEFGLRPHRRPGLRLP